jgi:GTPase Era involved in 16S rRNA processing
MIKCRIWGENMAILLNLWVKTKEKWAKMDEKWAKSGKIQ